LKSHKETLKEKRLDHNQVLRI